MQSGLKITETGWLTIICAVAAACFLPTVTFSFIAMDDQYYILTNPSVVDPNIFRIFDPRTLTVADWTPLVTLSHAIEYKTFGFAPWGYHLVNVVLHLMSIVLLHHILKLLGLSGTERLLSAAIFAFHPLQVESVAWLSARKDLLAVVFGLGFLKFLMQSRFAAAIICLLLALASKGTAVGFLLAAIPIVFTCPHLRESRGPPNFQDLN